MRRLCLALLLVAGCGDDPQLQIPDQEVCLERRDGLGYCIDVYEASREDASAESAGTKTEGPPRSLADKLPWIDVTWEAARGACQSKGKRLCERDEWIDACDGRVGEADGTAYTYGDELDATRCNVGGVGPMPSGAHPLCTGAARTFDQSGNVWEWTGNAVSVAAVRGGGFRSDGRNHECKAGDNPPPVYEPHQTSNEVGFRCCRDR